MADSLRQRRRRHVVLFPVLTGLVMAAGQTLAANDDKASDIFSAARAAVAAGRIAKTDALGFTLEKKPFSEAPAEGGVLVGFDVGLGKFVKDEWVFALRPIYRTAQGETTSQDFGLFHSPSEIGPKKFARKQVTRTLRLMAQADYAVGAMTLRTGVNIRGMSLTFMRINGQTLDPKQSYVSNWAGDDKSGREVSVGGNGAPIVGVFGNQNDDQQVVALGLIYIDDGRSVVGSVPAAPAIPSRTHSARSQSSGPSRVDQLKDLVRKQEAATAMADQDRAAASPPETAEVHENPPSGEVAAPVIKNAGEEEADKEPVPLWQSWKVMTPAALAILLASVIFGVQRFRPSQGVAEVASPRPPGSAKAAFQPGPLRRAAPAQPPNSHKIINGVIALIVGVSAALVGYEMAKGRNSTPGAFKEFTSNEGKFRVEMPGSPIRETAYAVGIPLVTFRVEEQDGAYGVAYADIPIAEGISSAQLKRALDSARDGMVRNVNGKFLGESSIRLDGKYPGREVRAELPIKDGLIKGRLYLAGRRVYMVMVTGLSSWVNSANAKRFLDSLEITR